MIGYARRENEGGGHEGDTMSKRIATKVMYGYQDITFFASPSSRGSTAPCPCKQVRRPNPKADPRYTCADTCGGTRIAGDFGLTWCRCKSRWFTRCSSCNAEILPKNEDEHMNLVCTIAEKENPTFSTEAPPPKKTCRRT